MTFLFWHRLAQASVKAIACISKALMGEELLTIFFIVARYTNEILTMSAPKSSKFFMLLTVTHGIEGRWQP